jgi:uncharacterized transporter YbjL
LKQYILDRAKEPSSWRGLILFLTAIGVPVAPELANNIVTVGLGLAGIIGMSSKG